ncbi:MAG: InlB B-repeat-containing protein, partial [Acutalibacteraceae bacterium]|nr:InlB B-repeat-containing protein [Acutalibacteraceae bacterium]
MKKVLLLIMVIALCFTFTACKAEVNVYLDESDEAFTDDNSSVDDTEDITDTESATSSDDEGMQAPAENNDASDDKGEGKKPTGSTDDKKPASSGGQSGTTPTPTPMPSGSATQEYTVTFNSNGGSAVSAAKTVGGKVTKPADPTRSGYKFMGWYKQGSSTAWNFGDKVTADITLVATWEAIEYNVTFDSAGGSAVASAKTSGKVTKPADPTRAGYIFAGWYKQGSSTAWNFGDKVTADITLVA